MIRILYINYLDAIPFLFNLLLVCWVRFLFGFLVLWKWQANCVYILSIDVVVIIQLKSQFSHFIFFKLKFLSCVLCEIGNVILIGLHFDDLIHVKEYKTVFRGGELTWRYDTLNSTTEHLGDLVILVILRHKVLLDEAWSSL